MLSSILILGSYFIAWAALHSCLASQRVKARAEKTFGLAVRRWYRLAYNAAAAITISPLLVLVVLLPDCGLYVVPAPWHWAMLAVQVLSLAALVWTILRTGPLHFAGLEQLWTRQPAAESPLQVRGLYCYVRHPLYLFSLILIWCTPIMTANLLVLYVLITPYFLVGSMHEERRLLAEFGEAYRDYQQRVPRLIPRLRRCYPDSDQSK
jgi:protein-S-isoprenylcysteine O-methyltransferase Ste14